MAKINIVFFFYFMLGHIVDDFENIFEFDLTYNMITIEQVILTPFSKSSNVWESPALKYQARRNFC